MDEVDNSSEDGANGLDQCHKIVNVSTRRLGGQVVEKLVCPMCSSLAQVQVFGPFFTPDPSYSYAVECSKWCCRGPLKQSAIGAIEAFNQLNAGSSNVPDPAHSFHSVVSVPQAKLPETSGPLLLEPSDQ